MLTKHFLFDCTHKKRKEEAYKLLEFANSSGKFRQIFLASPLSTPSLMSFILFDIKSQRFFFGVVSSCFSAYTLFSEPFFLLRF